MMMHPSYTELMEVVNDASVKVREEPVINSRYSIVIAAAHRARQLVDGAEPKMDEDITARKPLSVAVDELYSGAVKILGEDDEIDEPKCE